MDHRCLFCVCRSLEKLVSKHQIKDPSVLSEFFQLLSRSVERTDTPEISREIHQSIRKILGNPDPYSEEKKKHNDYLMEREGYFRSLIQESDHSFETALRLSIAGNIIDFGPGRDFEIDRTIKNVLESDFGIDQSKALYDALQKAENVLYLADNCGEIVLDKLFIEHINHPGLKVVVRGAPIINDATPEEARYVGIDKVAPLISNEYDAPSTIVEKSGEAFQKLFREADLIISKGQGNFEGLFPRHDPRIFFLMMVKCEVIGEVIGVDKGNFVVFSESRQA